MFQLAVDNKHRWSCGETADQWIRQVRRHNPQLRHSHDNLPLKKHTFKTTIHICRKQMVNHFTWMMPTSKEREMATSNLAES